MSALANGDVLVLLFSIVFGCALALIGEQRRVTSLIDDLSHVLFKTMGLIIKLAPLGVLGPSPHRGQVRPGLPQAAGHAGGAVLRWVVVIFVVVVLGFIMRVGFSLFKLLRYLREELAVVFATTSSDCRRSGQAQAHGHPGFDRPGDPHTCST